MSVRSLLCYLLYRYHRVEHLLQHSRWVTSRTWTPEPNQNQMKGWDPPQHFTYHPQFPATRCLPDWRWYRARRAPNTQAQWPGPHQTCSPPQSACAPLSAHTVRQSHCCLLRPGGGGAEGLEWRQEIPSARGRSGGGERETHETLQNHCINTHRADVQIRPVDATKRGSTEHMKSSSSAKEMQNSAVPSPNPGGD